MTAQTTAQPAASRARIAPAIALMFALLAFVAGLGLAHATAPAAVLESAVQAAPGFDAVRFRAGEREAWLPAPTFDAVHFRAGERKN